jgi:Zn-dependent M16 (insulinase) family peptidase
MTLEDVPYAARDYPLTQERVNQLTVFHHSCFTNEIVYADLNFALPDLPEKDLPYVRLFTVLLPQVGFGERDYSENLDYIQANTGGINASLAFNHQASDHMRFFPSFTVRGKALYRKVSKLFPLLKEMASVPVFTDVPRLKQIIMKHYTTLQSTLNQSSLKYAINLSASHLDVASKIVNAWYGLEYFWMVRDLAQQFDQQASWLVDKMRELQDKLLGIENPDLVLTCDAEIYDVIKGQNFYGLQDIELKSASPWVGKYPLAPVSSHGRLIASPIAFTGKVIKTVSYVHPDSPALGVAAFLLDKLTLHPRLREQGGAYGGGAINNALAGNFYFYAYRDPHVVSTLQTFDEAVANLSEGRFDESDLEEAKLEVVQVLDAPAAPGSRGDLAYGWLREGKTLEIRQAFRERVLGLTRQDVIMAVKRQLIPNLKVGAAVVFAGKELLEKENDKLIALGQSPLSLEVV